MRKPSHRMPLPARPRFGRDRRYARVEVRPEDLVLTGNTSGDGLSLIQPALEAKVRGAVAGGSLWLPRSEAARFLFASSGRRAAKIA